MGNIDLGKWGTSGIKGSKKWGTKNNTPVSYYQIMYLIIHIYNFYLNKIHFFPIALII